MGEIMTNKKRIQLRLRSNLYFHSILTVILVSLGLIQVIMGCKSFTHPQILLFSLSIFCLLIKGALYNKGFPVIQRYFWVFSLVDTTLLSLAYYLTSTTFNYLFPFYLICIFSTTREIVPGEVKLATALSLIGFSVNVLLLWKNGYIIHHGIPHAYDHYDFTAIIAAFSALVFAAILTYFLSQQDKKYMESMINVLQEKEDHVKRLNEVNASLEEKYAASYTLSLIQQYIHQELYESKLLTKIIDIVQGVLGSAFTAIYGLNDGEILNLLAFSGVKDFSTLLPILSEPKRLPYRALEEKRLLGGETATRNEIQLLRKHEINSLLCIPLYTKEVNIGVLVVSHFQENVFKPDQRDLLQIIGNQLSLALENIRLHQATEDMAWHDQLTGLYNRAYFNNYLETIKTKNIHSQKPLCFSSLVFDIDHFKQVNDLHGHLVGDEVLKTVAATLQNNTDEHSVAIRYGGEEFLILSTNTEVASVKKIANRIRLQISRLKFADKEGKIFSITISGGIAAIPEHAATTEEVLQKADEALYQAKQAGRNRIRIYKPVKTS